MTDDTSERDRGGRFVSGGKAGPGRPKGSRNKFAVDFLDAMASDFAAHGAAAIVRVREENPAAYMRCCVDVLPRQLDVAVEHGIDPHAILGSFRAAVAALQADAPQPPLKVINGKRS